MISTPQISAEVLTRGCVQVSDSGEGGVDVLSEVAMSNAYLICHNVQVTSRELRASISTFILHTC